MKLNTKEIGDVTISSVRNFTMVIISSSNAAGLSFNSYFSKTGSYVKLHEGIIQRSTIVIKYD